MSINRTCLHAFHIVAAEGSFSNAAQVYHVSQPTLSAQVKELETRYKVSLFERRGRGVRLTEIGRNLFEMTRKMFETESQIEQMLLSTQSKITGILRIGADSPFLIIPLMKKFQLEFPDVKLRVDFGNSRQLLESLKSRKYDVILLPDIKSTGSLYTQTVLSDRLIAFVNHNHTWSQKRSILIADVADQPIVLREKGSSTRQRFEAILKQREIALNPQNLSIISSREGVREAVAAGFGIGVVAESEFGHDQRLHPLTIRDVKSKHKEFLVCLANRKDEQIINAFFGSKY